MLFSCVNDDDAVSNEISISQANDDSFEINKNTSTVIDILSNDVFENEAEVIYFDTETELGGKIIVDENGEYTYTPAIDYTGDDVFTYTICDNESIRNCNTATVSITVVEAEIIVTEEIEFNIPTDLSEYYDGVSFSSEPDVTLQILERLTDESQVNYLTYGNRHDYLYNADEDLNNTANVVLMYTGESRDEREYSSGNNTFETQSFNTEHVYPRSFLDEEQWENDLHNLRSCDTTVNSQRSNYAFTDGEGDYSLINGNSWYPGDEWKGDVARIVLYLNMYYGESVADMGGLDLFLQWNVEDPVSDFEVQRNNIIEDAQGNRNPFIDNPYLATLIWGGNDAENTWE